MSQNSLPDLAQSLGDTLAALVLHPDCPAPVRSAALDFRTSSATCDCRTAATISLTPSRVAQSCRP
jgi:hypothetical protein